MVRTLQQAIKMQMYKGSNLHRNIYNLKMTHVYTTLIRVPADIMAAGYHKGRAFEIAVCIYDQNSDNQEEWVKLDKILAKPTDYCIDHIKTFGVVLACTRAGTAWNATIIVGGYAHVANYWLVGGLVAGSTMGVRFSGNARNKQIQSAQVCVVHSTAEEVQLQTETKTNLEIEDNWELYLKIATYNDKTSPYVLDGIVPNIGHDPMFRDPIQVVVCQHSPHTFFKKIDNGNLPIVFLGSSPSIRSSSPSISGASTPISSSSSESSSESGNEEEVRLKEPSGADAARAEGDYYRKPHADSFGTDAAKKSRGGDQYFAPSEQGATTPDAKKKKNKAPDAEKKKDKAPAAKKEEHKELSDADMGFGLFD